MQETQETLELVVRTHLPMRETQETWVWSLGQEDPMEEEMSTYSRIPWTEEFGRAPSMGLQRVGHDWACSMHYRCKIESQWKFAVGLRELKPGLSNNLERWDGEGGGKDGQVEGDMDKPMADTCWCLIETNIIL